MIMKKAQEEIAGFVAVVLIVTIIGLFLLGIMIKKEGNGKQTSSEVSLFLEGVRRVTIDCSYEGANYYSIGELIERCYSGKGCLPEGDSCFVLNKTLNKIILNSFNISEQGEIKGYIVESVFNSGNESEEIFYFDKGVCSNKIRGAEINTLADFGTIVTSLKLCY